MKDKNFRNNKQSKNAAAQKPSLAQILFAIFSIILVLSMVLSLFMNV